LPNESAVAVCGATLLALASGVALDSAQQREARALMRRLLGPHLGSRPLKSRELFRQLALP
jgi:DNA repair protein RecO (recombination protein O)